MISESLSDTKPGASVTETNILTYMGGYEVVPYTPHEHHLCDRISRQGQNMTFPLFSHFLWNRCFQTWSNLHQLPRETSWVGWERAWVWFIPPTSVDIVTENPLSKAYWEKSPKVPQGASGTSITVPNILPSWFYQCLTLCTTLGPIQHLPGAKVAILAQISPLAKGRTILHILNWLKTRPKAAKTEN